MTAKKKSARKPDGLAACVVGAERDTVKFYEQQLWDDIVRTSLARGDYAVNAVQQANEVIAGRRKRART